MLNENQKAAVSFLEGPALVLAGPGSGKTTVITKRIENLLRSGIAPEKILVITFTRAAAKEMSERFAKLCPHVNGVCFGTFHSVFFHILSKEYHYKAEDILKESTKNKILKDALRKQNISLWDEETLEAIFAAICKVKNGAVELSKISDEDYYNLNISGITKRKFLGIYKDYLAAIEINHLIDFDDMVVKTHKLFLEKEAVLKTYQKKYEYILIDEFQDISPIQYEVVKLMAYPKNNLFVVGDDDQSIYGFRGAKPSIMRDFTRDYEETAVINLDTNYRSSERIISEATKIICKNKDRFNKSIKCGSSFQDGLFEVLQYSDEFSEAKGVTGKIRSIHEKGVPFNEIAILYRNHRLAEAVEMQLIAEGIPANIRKSIKGNELVKKDILSYLAIAFDEGTRADYLNVMNKPDRGIMRQALDGMVSLKSIKEYYRGDSFVTSKIENWELLNKTLVKLEASSAISLIRYGFSYETYLRQKAPNQLKNLEKLVDDAKAFKSIESFRKYLLGESLDADNKDSRSNEDSVGLYTLHASKGLEFNTVFIIQANDGYIPQRKTDNKSVLEEERRLFYVGMTRAKENLIISTTKKSKNREMSPSLFLKQ